MALFAIHHLVCGLLRLRAIVVLFVCGSSVFPLAAFGATPNRCLVEVASDEASILPAASSGRLVGGAVVGRSHSVPPGGIESRHFEVDEGKPILVQLDPGGWAVFGPGETEGILEAAVAAWNVGPIRLSIVGPGIAEPIDPFLANSSIPIIIVRFEPKTLGVECQEGSGFAGVGYTSADRKVFNGYTFTRASGCIASAFYDPRYTIETCPEGPATAAGGRPFHRCRWVDLLAHELGHCLGLNHAAPGVMSGGTTDLCNCGRPTATDLAQLREIYPQPRPPHITTPNPLPAAELGLPYAVQLEAIGGSGEFSWSIGDNGVGTLLEFPDGLSLSETGRVSGVPTRVVGVAFGLAVATDSNGDSHMKLFRLDVLDSSISSSTTTTTTTVTTTTALALDPVEIECISTTTTTLGLCGGHGACLAATCHASRLRSATRELPRRLSRLRRIARRMSRKVTSGAVYLPNAGKPGRSARHLRSALRLAKKLERAAGSQAVIRRGGTHLAAAIGEDAGSLIAAIDACREAM